MSAIRHMVHEVGAYRELLAALAWRDIRVKYKQALMGVAWVVFMPLLAIGAGIIFRLAMAYFGGKALELTDVTRVMVKSLPWLLFASIVGSASNSLIGNTNLITKIYFPREVIPLAATLSALFDFAISAVGLVAVLVLIGLFGSAGAVALTPWLLLAPLLLALLVLLAVGLGLFLAAANLFFRDVKYIVQVTLQFGLFFSLVYYTCDELGRWGWVLLFNPVGTLLEALRMAVIDGAMPAMIWPFVAYAAALAVGLLFFASAVFERAEYRFAEYA